ncbi:MAG: PHP domain-containing protein [Nitrospinota bacterium]|jgi:hypothetical protein|nr:phosphatase [Nitrospinota bacterium]MDP6365978.1 PHP domain-containing protein [Nitrospinota bacterium]
MASGQQVFDIPEDSLVVDLHLHSSASDGEYPPRRVMERAKSAGLSVVSLTDHDTVAGLGEARSEAKRLGLEFVNGIELSSVHGGHLVHVLGHFIRPEDPELGTQMKMYMESRRTRMGEMLERLRALSVPIDKEDFLREYGRASSIGRGHLSAYMVRKNLVSNREEVFGKYLGEGGPAYVELAMIAPDEAVRLIAGAGGAATLAHPNLSESDEIIPELVSAGLAGIEVEHPSQDEKARRHYLALAERYGLIPMGGSDCHGARPGPERIGQFRQPVRNYLGLRRRAKAAL